VVVVSTSSVCKQGLRRLEVSCSWPSMVLQLGTTQLLEACQGRNCSSQLALCQLRVTGSRSLTLRKAMSDVSQLNLVGLLEKSLSVRHRCVAAMHLQ